MGISDGIFKRITKWNHERKGKNTLIQLKKKKKKLSNKKCKPDAVRDDW